MLLCLGQRRLYYDLFGPDSARIVCFAHALAADSGMWAEQVPALVSSDFRVLRIDMRGHGGSDATAGDYSMQQLASDIVSVLDTLDIANIDYVGLSIGGMIGQALAIDHPSRVRSLMLCQSPPASLPNANEIWGPRVASVRAANSLEPIADATMERWLTEQFRRRNPIRWQAIRNTVAATSVDGYCGCIAALSKFDFTERLPALRAPALALFGEHDPASSRSENEQLAALIPGGRFVAVPGARHLPNVEQAQQFNTILLQWLASV